MRIKLSTAYGSHEKYDLEITKLSLDTTDLDEKLALESGWLISNGEWYFSRSTRIRISEVRVKSTPRIYGVEFGVESFDQIAFDAIYEDYMTKKRFKRYDYKTDFNRTFWLVARDDGIPVAFTKMVRYDGGMESAFNVWNYHKPKLSLGSNMLYHEIEQARLSDLEFLYIGSGYGESGKYKSMVDGFEWWTGENWSTDRKLYLEMCEHDASVNSLYDLSKTMNAQG